MILAPDNLANNSFEDYYLYREKEFLIVLRKKINDVEKPQKVKVYVNLRGFGPHHIMVCNDKLCKNSRNLPGKVEESKGLPVFDGLTADGEQIIVHIR